MRTSSLGLLHGALSTIVWGQLKGVDVNTLYSDASRVPEPPTDILCTGHKSLSSCHVRKHPC